MQAHCLAPWVLPVPCKVASLPASSVAGPWLCSRKAIEKGRRSDPPLAPHRREPGKALPRLHGLRPHWERLPLASAHRAGSSVWHPNFKGTKEWCVARPGVSPKLFVAPRPWPFHSHRPIEGDGPSLWSLGLSLRTRCCGGTRLGGPCRSPPWPREFLPLWSIEPVGPVARGGGQAQGPPAGPWECGVPGPGSQQL